MSPAPEVQVHADPTALAAAAAAQVVSTLVRAQAERGEAAIVVTGGGTGIAVLEQVRSTPDRDDVDWSRVDVYWGDERYLPTGHPDRNETQARTALLDHVPVDPDRVFPMAAPDGPDGDDPEAGAAAYAALLAEQGRRSGHGPVPSFDVLLLGMGGEGHVASLFPDSPAVREAVRTVTAVRDCPKPPPTRISLTLGAVRQAAEVWLVVGGQGKATAVQQALTGADELAIPAAGARGRQRTLWVLDRAAAGGLPPELLPAP